MAMDSIITIFDEAARAAGKVALTMQSEAAIAVDKGNRDFATQADIEAGVVIRAVLDREMPGVPILSEEQPKEEQAKVLKQSSFILFDDLDATVAYYNQCPDWGHNIEFVQYGKLTHSVMYLPTSNTMVTAQEGQGCHINGKRIHIPKDVKLEKSILGIIFNHGIPLSFHV